MNRLKSAIEAMLFVWGDPIDAKELATALELSEIETIDLLCELKEDYELNNRGLRIRRIKNSFQLVTAKENCEYIQKLCTKVKLKKLTQSALEVLAIIAYKQPVTKTQIDSIRGVKSDKVLEGLLAKNLIVEKGRSKAIGRPILYATTDEFLKHMGFESLDDLPIVTIQNDELDWFSEHQQIKIKELEVQND